MASGFNPLQLLQQSGHPIFSARAQELVSNPAFAGMYQQFLTQYAGSGKTPAEIAAMAAQQAASTIAQQQQAQTYQRAVQQGMNPQQAQITSAAPNALDFSSKTGAVPGSSTNPGVLSPLSQDWTDRMVGQAGSNPEQYLGGPSSYYQGDVSKLQQYPTGTPSSPARPPLSYDRYGRLIQPGTSPTPGQPPTSQSPYPVTPGSYTPPGAQWSAGDNYNIPPAGAPSPPGYTGFEGEYGDAGYTNEPPTAPGYTGYPSDAPPPGSELAAGNAGRAPWIPQYPNTPSNAPPGYTYPYSPADYGAVGQGGRPNTYTPTPGNTDIYPFSGQTGYQDPNYFYQVNTPPYLPQSAPSYDWSDNSSNTGFLGGDPSLLARSDRARALSGGSQLSDTFNVLRNQAYGSQRAYEQAGARAYAPIAAGQGGYTQEERAGILRPDELYGLYQSPEEQARTYLTPAEQEAIYADPSSAYQAYDWTASSLGQGLDESAGNQRAAYQAGKGDIYSYLDPNKLTMSDQDVRDIEMRAANTVRTGTQADLDRIYSASAQSGMNAPGALGTALTRRAYTGDVNAADAMTNARIQARQAQLDSNQEYAGLGTGIGLTEQQRAMQLEQGIGGEQLGARQYLGSQLSDAAQYADTAASARASNLAGNRQTAETSNQAQRYNRGTNIYNTASDANTQFADQRQKAEQEYRNWLTGQESQASQNVNIAGQQQIGTYGATTGATQGATGNLIRSEQGPDPWQKILGYEHGGVMSGPTPAVVGEAGPELIVRLDKMPKMADGDVIDPYLGDFDPANTGMQPAPSRNDPMYKEILRRMYQAQFGQGQQQQQQQPQSGGGLLGAGMKIAGLFMADGGVVEPGGGLDMYDEDQDYLGRGGLYDGPIAQRAKDSRGMQPLDPRRVQSFAASLPAFGGMIGGGMGPRRSYLPEFADGGVVGGDQDYLGPMPMADGGIVDPEEEALRILRQLGIDPHDVQGAGMPPKYTGHYPVTGEVGVEIGGRRSRIPGGGPSGGGRPGLVDMGQLIRRAAEDAHHKRQDKAAYPKRYADGGVVDGGYPMPMGSMREKMMPQQAPAYGRRGMRPPMGMPATRPMEYVDRPQVRTLGAGGPTAVIPLQPGPRARVTMNDLPRLTQQYGR